ncbi:MAG: tyrosine-type recombinase/integrase [Actinomycetota bacterium]|nr:tyrosine-type recombinase/integrase [Actinomycetota bacterium]
MSVVVAVGTAGGLLDAYAQSQHLLGGSPSYQRDRLTAARRFLEAHPDLKVWMARPLEARLIELRRRRLSWPLVVFALLTGRCQADADFLFAKNFGHTMARLTAGLFAEDWQRLTRAAERLEMSTGSARRALREQLPLIVAFTGRAPASLTVADLDALAEAIETSQALDQSGRRHRRAGLFALRRVLFEAGVVDEPAVHRREGGPATPQGRLAAVTAPEIRWTILAYLDARAAVLRPKSIEKLTSALAIFGEFLSERFPQVTSLADLDRHHVEAFMTWTATRTGRGSQKHVRRVGASTIAHAVITLRAFLDDIAAWGWAQAPPRRLVFTTDIPSQPETLPRALAPDVDAALMSAVAELDDQFARVGLTVMRHTGLRVGELLDLELDCIIDYGPAGSWLRVPLGKLNNERAVPLDQDALEALDLWLAQRSRQRPLPHPRDGRMADFVFVEHGRKLGPARLSSGLRRAVRAAGLVGPDGKPLRIVSHQLRHTYATSLVNAGMSLQALMALLGHRSPEMTIRYARLASPTLRAAYEQAIVKMRQLLPITPAVAPALPDRVEWLRSEMLKTRVAHGYCARELAAAACPYANICETCPNFTTAPEFEPALTAQLADVRRLRDDADTRGWTSEVARHERVIDSLEGHLRRLQRDRERTPHP